MSDLILDPHFETLGLSGSKWAIIAQRGVVMNAVVDGTILRLEISQTNGANWQGALRYSPFPVAVGEVLTVTFEAKAELPFTFSVWLGQQDSPYQSLVSAGNHFGEKMLTPEWQTFSHTWRVHLEEPAARLNFVLGQIDNVVEIQDIHLTKHPGQADLPG